MSIGRNELEWQKYVKLDTAPKMFVYDMDDDTARKHNVLELIDKWWRHPLRFEIGIVELFLEELDEYNPHETEATGE